MTVAEPKTYPCRRARGDARGSLPRTAAPACSIVELVARIQSGDPRAEAELVKRFRRGIEGALWRTLGGRAEAEDLAQETLYLALRKIRGGELREPRKLPGFLSGLARNLAVGHLRREARHRDDDGSEAVERLEHSGPTPLANLLASERTSLVLRVLDELRNPRDRQVLFRFYLAEDDKQEICQDLGLSDLHFNRVLYRARQRCRELYEKVVAGEPGLAVKGGIFSAFGTPAGRVPGGLCLPGTFHRKDRVT